MTIDRSARIVMFPDGNFLAHVTRVVEIAKVLRRAHGCDVRFAGAGPFMALVRDAGFSVDPCFTVPRADTLALASRATIVDPFWWLRIVERSIRSDVCVIRARRPDVVVGDMHWSLRAASLACGVPYVSIVNAAWTRYSAHPLSAPDDHLITRLLGARLATTAMPTCRSALLWHWAWPYKFWALKHHVRGHWTTTLANVMEGDLTLLPDVPEIAPTMRVPDRVRYVGPILWDAPIETPPWVHALDPDRTVYVSAGSTGTAQLFALAVEALAHSDYDVVMTTGHLDVATATVPSNVRVAQYLPGLEVMRRSALSVNHGGNGTVYQALTCGVPIVGIPSHVDQQVQLQLCERAGVGRKLVARTLTAKALRAAVDDILHDPGSRQRARLVRDAIARHDGPREAAAAIVSVARGATPAALPASSGAGSWLRRSALM
jgi:MGT family glycosyltransferase